MDEQSPQELFNTLANEFKRRVRKRFWKLSASFSDEDLEAIALSHLYEAWSQRWDTMRPFENFARTSAWQNFLNELKDILGKIPDSGLLVHPDSADAAQDVYPPVPPAPTHEEKCEAEKAEEIIDELKGAEGERRKDRILLARRRFLMEAGFGEGQGEGICHRLDCDLHPDVASVVQRSEVKWLSVLLRRHALINHGRSMISDDWIDRLPTAEGLTR